MLAKFKCFFNKHKPIKEITAVRDYWRNLPLDTFRITHTTKCSCCGKLLDISLHGKLNEKTLSYYTKIGLPRVSIVERKDNGYRN